ncbi:MAG TPA: hypothetical protein VI819_04640 [Patescibacteria group bacterium]|nr:hypothetical protein [Patescibacteria group bacterium]
MDKENKNQELLPEVTRALQKIYSIYGKESDWGWLVKAVLRCRLAKLSSFKAMELRSDILLGKKKCPMSGITTDQFLAPHPADNIAGAIAARNFPEKCPLCGQEPGVFDFDIE